MQVRISTDALTTELSANRKRPEQFPGARITTGWPVTREQSHEIPVKWL